MDPSLLNVVGFVLYRNAYFLDCSVWLPVIWTIYKKNKSFSLDLPANIPIDELLTNIQS